MSANLEWNVHHRIQSTYGSLKLNDETETLGLYLLIQDGCEALRPLRVTVDDIPQADGSIHHRRFTGGYEIELTISLWQDRNQPACDCQAKTMAEALMLHLNTMLNDTGRLFWQPSCHDDERMLDEARVRELSAWTYGPASDPRITVRLDSPFPYVLDATQATVDLGSATIPNDGNVEMFPVVKVYGPSSGFTLENETVGQQLTYDDDLPGAVAIGGGDYVEFDFFRNTAYLNGDEDPMKAGIDIEVSDFWPLVPGDNEVTITGATADLLYNHAYA